MAARVPDGPTPPQKTGQLEASLNARNAALSVLQLLLQQGEQRLALRAAGRIRDVASRARVYGEIARAFPVKKEKMRSPHPLISIIRMTSKTIVRY